MSTQQSQSQPVSQSQTHTDFLVGIATENASLKVQIKQEYDNSCAIVHQINKSIRKIDSCKRDLNKFKELQEAKFSELKRLEADLDSSHLSRERIKNNIDHFKQGKDQIALEELQKQVTRFSICANYEQMVQHQMEINSSHPCVKKKDSMHNSLKQYEIELAVLKKRIEEWQRKENQIRTIQGMMLNVEVVELAKVFTKRRKEYRKKVALAAELDKQKVELKKQIENQNKTKRADPVVFHKPAPPFAIARNISAPKLSSNIAPSFQSLSGSIAKQSDLMKYFQQVSAFKTPLNQFAFPPKISRSFSPHNVNQKLRVPFSRTLKSPSRDHPPSKASAVRVIGEKAKHVEKSDEYCGIKNVNDQTDPSAAVNASSCIAPVQNASISQDSVILNSEVAAINSENEAAQPTDTSLGDVAANGKLVSSQATSCRSNCSTPVSVKSVSSQKGRPDRPRSRILTLKSPRPADSMRASANFSPIAKASFTPKIFSKRNTSAMSSWKPYRTPDILQKITQDKLLFANRTCSSGVPLKPPKQARIDRDASSYVVTSKSKNISLGASVDARRVEEDGDVATKSDKESISEIRNVKMCPTTRIRSSSPTNRDLKNSNPVEDNEEANLNKENNLQPKDVEVLSSEASHSKYFPNSNIIPQESIRGDGNFVGETCSNNLQSSGENVFSGSVDDASKANSTGSNSSHFSSMIMRESGDNSSSPPMGNFLMPFSCSTNEGNGFGFGNSNENDGFTLSGGFTSTDTNSNNPFVFKFSDDSSKPTFSLF